MTHLHASCRYYRPATSANGHIINDQFFGECEIPCVRIDNNGDLHAAWRAVMGDETTDCRDFKRRKKK